VVSSEREAAERAGWVGWLRSQDAALSLFLAMVLLGTVLAWPLQGILPEWVFDASVVATVVVGVIVVAPTPRVAVVAGILGVAITVSRLVGVGRLTLLETVPPLLFFALIDAALLARVFRPGRITVHRLLGAVALFVVLGVTWGLAYQILEVIKPGSILIGGQRATPQDAMWLSFATLTTVGYGDVVPVSRAARAVAAIEALTGVLYPSVLIGFLLSDVARARSGDPGDGPART
jgi:hypothetical protein